MPMIRPRVLRAEPARDERISVPVQDAENHIAAIVKWISVEVIAAYRSILGIVPVSRTAMGLLLFAVAFSALLTGICNCQLLSAQTPANGPVQTTSADPFGTIIQDDLQQIRTWERQANIEIACFVLAGAFGVVIAALQPVKKPWTNVLTIALGIAVGVLTLINGKVFMTDYRSFQHAADEGKAIVRELDGMSVVFHLKPPVGKDFDTFLSDLARKIDKFNQISAKWGINGGAVSVAHLLPKTPDLLPVYAQTASEIPAWTEKVPSDSRSFYYVGTSRDGSLATAKANSLNDAVSKASQALFPGEPYTSDTSINTSAKDAGVVQDTFFNYEVKSGVYTYFTLFRISRSISSFRPTLTRYQNKGWHPLDLTFDPSTGLFVLDDDGSVSKVNIDQRGIHLKTLFRLEGSYQPTAVTANAQSIFVSSISALGCTVFQYSFSSGRSTRHLVATHQGCNGIATDGSAVYLLVPESNEVRYWRSWGSSSPEYWSFSQIQGGGALAFDHNGGQLIFANLPGTAYTISVSEHKIQQLAANVGTVNSIATNSDHILLASGKKVLFYARVDHQGENPPGAMHALLGGRITGVAVDTTQSVWITDIDNGVIQGPFPLN